MSTYAEAVSNGAGLQAYLTTKYSDKPDVVNEILKPVTYKNCTNYFHATRVTIALLGEDRKVVYEVVDNWKRRVTGSRKICNQDVPSQVDYVIKQFANRGMSNYGAVP